MTGEMYNIRVVTEGMQLVGSGKGPKEQIVEELSQLGRERGVHIQLVGCGPTNMEEGEFIQVSTQKEVKKWMYKEIKEKMEAKYQRLFKRSMEHIKEDLLKQIPDNWEE